MRIPQQEDENFKDLEVSLRFLTAGLDKLEERRIAISLQYGKNKKFDEVSQYWMELRGRCIKK